MCASGAVAGPGRVTANAAAALARSAASDGAALGQRGHEDAGVRVARAVEVDSPDGEAGDRGERAFVVQETAVRTDTDQGRAALQK